ncbi:hypothetical protein [Mesonia aestuariivivens]|uniref:Right-handed parallel beta-helix repeat-containing protein n=1 Tax=Mesonia aestuariivivens TaxID=2796128 RepID=A0ABS6W0C8_9FLAO|nr:hypothetical protein [Mesonia aestuariivivens]MBW2961315.1 hypothetical protein [Mesonia aestuariivivens]
MRHLYSLLLLCSIVLWSSCRNDFETKPNNGNLQFSKDTVYLDTIFTGIASSTYNLKVYNKSDEDITIPSIELSNGENSKYRLNVDGLPGKSFQNIDILAKDSIYVFIETTANIDNFSSTNEYLYTDAIQFDTGAKQQKVELVTLLKDAIFLYPEKFNDGSTESLSFGVDEEGNETFIEGFFLDDSELNFNNQKPYVIYGYAAVPGNRTLTIDAGSRIHFHKNSGIIVAENGSLHVNGELSSDQESLEKEVIFESDRQEPNFSDTPGQWGAIWLTQGSTNNSINYTTIKNATVGVLMDSNDGTSNPTLSINNSKIYNSSNVGLLARTGNIEGSNLVINNAGQSALQLSLGGTYNFTNCTFANYWTGSYRSLPAVLLQNYLETAEEIFASDLIEANFYNCIIYGNENRELILDPLEEVAFNYKFENCLIKFNKFGFGNNEGYNFEDETLFPNSIINEDPNFLDASKNLFMINEESAANSLANPSTATSQDILGQPRNNEPDTGAYESIIFPEE